MPAATGSACPLNCTAGCILDRGVCCLWFFTENTGAMCGAGCVSQSSNGELLPAPRHRSRRTAAPLPCLQVLDACLKEIATALLQADVNVRLVANLRCARGCLRRLPLRLRLQQCAMRAAPCHLAGSLLSACSCEVHLLVGIMHNSG